MIIYTCITNAYCELPELEDLGHEYICFTDGTVEAKSPWQLREINYKSDDPVVLSRHPKILFHEYFDEPSVYVDASRLHLVNNNDFFEIARDIFGYGEIFLMQHPDQHNYFEECFEYYVRSWVDEDKIVDFTKYLKDNNFDFQDYDTIFASIMWRKPDENTIKWSKLWWELYEKCHPRDQLTGSVSLKLSGVDYVTEHPYNIVSEFLYYKDFWYDKSGGSGSYSNGKTQIDWKNFLGTLSEITGIDYSQNINLSRLTYLRSKGLGGILDEMQEENITGEENNSEGYQLHIDAFLEQRGGYDFTVYTCITNNYDKIPDENYYDPRVRYVCFHDGTLEEYKGPWEYIDVRDYCDLECPRRLSSFPKINPHKLFESGTHTVWIDACYIQTEQFVEFGRTVFPTTVTTMEHCYKFSFYDEMLEGFMCSFFSYEQGMELTKKLAEAGYNFKEYSSPCCTMIWRTVWDESRPEFRKFCDLWWEWSLIGSNRDQHSFDAARQFSGIEVNQIYNKPPGTKVAGVDLRFDLKNKNRKGKHPKRGGDSQYKLRDKFLKEMQEYTKLSPRIYAKHEHITMMDWNGAFDSEDERKRYVMTSPTMRNLTRQQSLWRGTTKTINDAVWSDHKGHDEKRKAATMIDKIRKSYN